MKTIFHTEYQGVKIIGNINFCLENLVEIRLISPYNGFTLQSERETVNPEPGVAEEDFLKSILQQAYEICKVLQENAESIKNEFIKLQDTLQKFGNTKTDDYQRNRDELMKVLISQNFPKDMEWMSGDAGIKLSVFRYLHSYFSENGVLGGADFRTEFSETAEPPEFEILPELLNQYLAKTEQEKVELIASQILTGKTGIYDWFLQQEFFEKRKKHNQLL